MIEMIICESAEKIIQTIKTEVIPVLGSRINISQLNGDRRIVRVKDIEYLYELYNPNPVVRIYVEIFPEEKS